GAASLLHALGAMAVPAERSPEALAASGACPVQRARRLLDPCRAGGGLRRRAAAVAAAAVLLLAPPALTLGAAAVTVATSPPCATGPRRGRPPRSESSRPDARRRGRRTGSRPRWPAPCPAAAPPPAGTRRSRPGEAGERLLEPGARAADDPEETAMDSKAWDERYRATGLVWGAGPNRFVVEQTEGLAPGRAQIGRAHV